MPYLLALVSAASYGANIFFVHAGARLGKVDGSHVLIINLLAGMVFLLLVEVGVCLKAGLPRIDWVGIAFFCAAGLGGPFLGRMFSIQAIQRIGGSRTSSLRMSEVLLTIVLAYLILGERISPVAFVGAATLLGGILLLVNKKGERAQAAEAGGYQPHGGGGKPASRVCLAAKAANPGILFAFISAMFFSAARILSQMGLNAVPSPVFGALCGTVAALFSNGLVLVFSGRCRAPWGITPRQFLLFVFSGVGNSLGLLTLLLAMSMGGLVSLVGALKNTSPLFTLLLTWLFLRGVDRIDAKLVVAIALVVAGAILIVI